MAVVIMRTAASSVFLEVEEVNNFVRNNLYCYVTNFSKQHTRPEEIARIYTNMVKQFTKQSKRYRYVCRYKDGIE